MAKRKCRYICYNATDAAGSVGASNGDLGVSWCIGGGSGSGTQINDDKTKFSIHGNFAQTLQAIYGGNGAVQTSTNSIQT